MNKILTTLILIVSVCFLSLTLFVSMCQGEPVTFVDDSGQEIALHEPAQRIISLYSAHTENLFALGLDPEIIGVGRVDIYPPKALEKPKYDWKSDPEKVIAAEPDAVIIRPFIKRSRPNFIAALERAGLRVVTLYPDSFEEFGPYIRKLALLTGKTEQAENLLQTFYQEIQDIQKLTAQIAPKVHVYFESVEKGYKTVTPDSMPGRAIEAAGGLNIAKDAEPVRKGSSIAAYGVERILEHADEIDVFVSQRGAMHAGGSVHSISVRPGFYAIKAVKNEKIYVINEKLISSPTFRYIKGIRELARMFYPEMMDDLSRFSTDNTVTRGEMAEIAVRFKHKPIFAPTSRYYRKKHKGHTYGTFVDVDIQHPAFDFIETAVTSGYMAGEKKEGKERFYPDRPVTRDELAKVLFMLRDFGKADRTVEIKDLEQTSKPRIVQILVNHGVMSCQDGYFYPEKAVSGKEVVEILQRLHNLT